MKCEWNRVRPISTVQIWADNSLLPAVEPLDDFETAPLPFQMAPKTWAPAAEFQPREGRALLSQLRRLMKQEVCQHCGGESGAYRLEEAVELLNVLTDLECSAPPPPRFHSGPRKWLAQGSPESAVAFVI